MQHYEIKNYFGRSYASTCQHCGITIYKRNRNGNGKHAWLAYSKAAYRHDADYEVLCRECYDEAVRKYGPMISRDEMLKKIDKWVRAEAKKSSTSTASTVSKVAKPTTTTHRTGTSHRKETSRVQENFEQPQELQQTQKHQNVNESFKPYPIYTRSNVNLLLNAYKKAKKIKKAEHVKQLRQAGQLQQSNQLSNINDFHINEVKEVNEATIKSFLTFITGFTVGAGMTKRPVMLDAAHKYIGRWFDQAKNLSNEGNKENKENKEDRGYDASDLDSISDFFDSMATLGMIRDSVAKKARNICWAIKNNAYGE